MSRLRLAILMLVFVGGNAMAAKAAPTDPNTPTKTFVAYCEAKADDCALFLDSLLIQGFWGFPENGPACKDPPANFQTEDARNLLLPWIRTYGFTNDPLRWSFARATHALTSSLCPPIKARNSN